MRKTSDRDSVAALTLGALGVVYGDIGTSPLYTMKEVFSPATGVPLDSAHLIGAVSVIFWGLMMVVTLKYVLLILRADNRGEGGIMALTALAAKAAGTTPRRRLVLLLIGVFGAALFYGDSVITPAISVLSAVEGLEVITPAFKPYVLPICAGVLVGLFAMQRFGTAVVGKLFGPVIALWFVVLAVTGVIEIAQQPAILAALNPFNALAFLRAQGCTCLSPSARSCWRSPARKRFMPTWAISANDRSSTPGSAWCCPRWRFTTWGKAPC